MKRAYPGRIVFDHLQKTAGQAVNAWLREALGTGSVSPNLISEHRTAIRDYGGAHSVISGHLIIRDGDQQDPRYDYVTVLRDPVDRAVSWIYFLLHDTPRAPETESLIEGARRFLDSGGAEATPAFLDSVNNPYVLHFGRYGSLGAESLDDRLRLAEQALSTYRVVGFYENLPEFMTVLARLVGAPAPGALPRVNTTSRRPGVDEIAGAVRARIEALTSFDRLLYDCLRRQNAVAIQCRIIQSMAQIVEPVWSRYDSPDPVGYSVPEFSVTAVELPGGETVEFGQPLRIQVSFDTERRIDQLNFGIHVWDCWDHLAFGTNSSLLGLDLARVEPGSHRVDFELPANLPEGPYTAGFAAEALADDTTVRLMWHDKLCSFRVTRVPQATSVGYVHLDATMAFVPQPGVVPEAPRLS